MTQIIKLLDVVALTDDLPEYNLWRGQVGTVVEILAAGKAYEVEFSDREGRTYESKRYGVPDAVAEEELMDLDYYDEILIQRYEKDGIKWEYMIEPLSGEMVVVPEGTEDHGC